MRIAVIGAGSIGKRHARNVKALGHEVFLCDSDETMVRQFFFDEPGLHSAWTHVRAMVLVNDPFDAVLICTPAKTHAEIGRELRDSGYAGPLFVEKPLALSSEDCEVFRDWPNITTQVGYMLRFHPFIVAMRRVPIKHGMFSMWCDMRAWPGRDYAPAAWELSHEVDLALHLGAPAQVESEQIQSQLRLYLGDWLVTLDGEYEKYRRSWNITTDGRGWFGASFEASDQLSADELYRAELAHFLDCVKENKPTITPFADGIRVVEVIEAAMKMAQKEHA